MEFFIRHHLERLTSESFMHAQPWWFYLPVFLGLLLPWSPLATIPGPLISDPRRRFFFLWILLGLIVFSVSVNKLPGYILPLFPASGALAAIMLESRERAPLWLALCAALLIVFPVAAPAAPSAIALGLTHSTLPQFHWTWLLPVPAVAAVWILEDRGRRLAALTVIGLGAAAGVIALKLQTAPELDRFVSARGLWTQIRTYAGQVCVESANRGWRYGLNYYSVDPLPDCAAEPRPYRIVQTPGVQPQIVRNASAGLTEGNPALYPHSSSLESRNKP